MSSRSADASASPPTRDLQHLQAHADAEQSLLGSVVEVSLESPALLVAGAHDARTRLAQRHQLRAQLGLQPLVLERHARGGPDRLEHRGLIQQHRIVDDRGELVPDQRDRPVRPVGSTTGRPDSSAQVPGSGSQRASSSVGSPTARASARRTPPGPGPVELDDEVADGSPHAAADEQAEERGQRSDERGRWSATTREESAPRTCP